MGERGIDLGRYAEDVRKIFFAHFNKQVEAAGLDPEDVLQEVYIGLMARNRGKNPWNPHMRGGRCRGSYIYLVTSSVVKNVWRRDASKQRPLQLSDHTPAPGLSPETQTAAREALRRVYRRDRRYVRALLAGRTLEECRRHAGLSRHAAERLQRRLCG